MESLKIGDSVTIKDLSDLMKGLWQFYKGDLGAFDGQPAKITGESSTSGKISDFNAYSKIWTVEICAPKEEVKAMLKFHKGESCATIELPAEFLSKSSGGRRRRRKTRKTRKTRKNLRRS